MFNLHFIDTAIVQTLVYSSLIGTKTYSLWGIEQVIFIVHLHGCTKYCHYVMICGGGGELFVVHFSFVPSNVSIVSLVLVFL